MQTSFFTINLFIMQRILLLSLSIMLSCQVVFATTYTFTQEGDWETAANWQGGNMPPNPLPAGDNIEIKNNCLLSSGKTISGTLTIYQPNKLTIQSGGSLIVDGLVTSNGIGNLRVNAGASVTVNAGKTFSFGEGAVTVFESAMITNNGTIEISTILNMYGTFTNTGTYNAYGTTLIGSGAGGGTCNNSGIINNTGEFTLHGMLTLIGGGTFNNNGTLKGGGTFVGNFTNPPVGKVFVFGSGNNCVDFIGDFINQGTLAFYYVGDVPCLSQTKLNVSGALTLGGKLEVNFNLATPITMSIVYTFIEAGSVSGTFSTMSIPNAPTSTVQYNNPGAGKVTLYHNPGKTITASAGSGGSISPAGATTVAIGANQAFSITPNMGNCIQSVLVDGVNVGAVASYTFSNVTANHTISATFAAANTWYLDADGDGYYVSMQSACASPGAGWKSAMPTGGNGDCNDSDATIYPGATDICDSKDNDCDNTVDEGGNGTSPGWAAGNVGGATNTTSSFTCGSGSGAGTVMSVNSQGFSGAANADLIFSNYQQRCGDASITVHLLGNPAPGWAGIYIREDLTPGSKMVALKTNLSSFLRRESRTTVNGNKTTSQNPLYATNTWVRIERVGNTFTYYTSPNGMAWTAFGSATIAMNTCIYLGIFAESINAGTTITASFDNVTVTGGTPAPLAAAPNSGFTAMDEQPTLDFNLYPNPASDNVYLQLTTKLSENQPLQIQVFDVLGRQVNTSEVDDASGELQLDQLGTLPNGAYWIKVQASGFAPVTKRVMLQR